MAAPSRIVSLVPSLTELICWLGRGEALVGRTRFCTEPAEVVERVPEIGGTKNPDIAAMEALAPDLVIANREENRREDVEALRARGFRVIVTDPNTIEGALVMITELGEVLGASQRADALVADVQAAVAEDDGARTRVFVPIWLNPLMGLGSETYGSSLIEAAGGENVLAHRARYPELTMDEVAALAPCVILLPDEPYRFSKRHLPQFEAIAPAHVVDGRRLWWYGPRMPHAIRELRAMLAGSLS